jgi:hypothetical protein
MKTLRILLGVTLLTLTALASPLSLHCDLHNVEFNYKGKFYSNGNCIEVYEHTYQAGFPRSQTYIHHLEQPCS